MSKYCKITSNGIHRDHPPTKERSMSASVGGMTNVTHSFSCKNFKLFELIPGNNKRAS